MSENTEQHDGSLCPVCKMKWIFHTKKQVEKCGKQWGISRVFEELAKID